MSAGKYNILVEQGATYSLKLRVKNSDNTYKDLTGHTFTGQIRATVSRDVALASFTFQIPTQTGADLGVVYANISATATAAISVPVSSDANTKNAVYVYDIKSNDGTGTINRWVEGTATISPGVSRV